MESLSDNNICLGNCLGWYCPLVVISNHWQWSTNCNRRAAGAGVRSPNLGVGGYGWALVVVSRRFGKGAGLAAGVVRGGGDGVGVGAGGGAGRGPAETRGGARRRRVARRAPLPRARPGEGEGEGEGDRCRARGGAAARGGVAARARGAARTRRPSRGGIRRSAVRLAARVDGPVSVYLGPARRRTAAARGEAAPRRARIAPAARGAGRCAGARAPGARSPGLAARGRDVAATRGRVQGYAARAPATSTCVGTDRRLRSLGRTSTPSGPAGSAPPQAAVRAGERPLVDGARDRPAGRGFGPESARTVRPRRGSPGPRAPADLRAGGRALARARSRASAGACGTSGSMRRPAPRVGAGADGRSVVVDDEPAALGASGAASGVARRRARCRRRDARGSGASFAWGERRAAPAAAGGGARHRRRVPARGRGVDGGDRPLPRGPAEACPTRRRSGASTRGPPAASRNKGSRLPRDARVVSVESAPSRPTFGRAAFSRRALGGARASKRRRTRPRKRPSKSTRRVSRAGVERRRGAAARARLRGPGLRAAARRRRRRARRRPRGRRGRRSLRPGSHPDLAASAGPTSAGPTLGRLGSPRRARGARPRAHVDAAPTARARPRQAPGGARGECEIVRVKDRVHLGPGFGERRAARAARVRGRGADRKARARARGGRAAAARTKRPNSASSAAWARGRWRRRRGASACVVGRRRPSAFGPSSRARRGGRDSSERAPR